MKTIKIIISIIVIVGCLSTSLGFHQNYDFKQYIASKSEQRNNESTIPGKDFIKLSSIGHENSYVDFMWLGMIQYIGSNLSKGNYTNFSLKTIERITEISPKFSTAYEWALWLMPIPQTSTLTYSDEEKNNLQLPLQIANRGIMELCDLQKISTIEKMPINSQLWENESLKNPCKNGMIPYLIAFYGGQLMDEIKVAEKFYKVAGMQDDTPGASKILAILSTAPKDDPRTLASNFFLMAIEGVDPSDDQICRNISAEALQVIQKNQLSRQLIETFSQAEKTVKSPTKNENLGKHSCFDMMQRGMKQLFLYYITQEGKKFPEITHAEDLIQKIGLKEVPTVQIQENFSIKKINGVWGYYAK